MTKNTMIDASNECTPKSAATTIKNSAKIFPGIVPILPHTRYFGLEVITKISILDEVSFRSKYVVQTSAA